MELILGIDTSKSSQIGTKVRCAVAFGCSMVCIIGNRKYSTNGSHGAQKFIKIRHFYYLHDFIDFVKERGCKLYGISSLSYDSDFTPSNQYEQSLTNIENCQFNESIAFIIGNKHNMIEDAHLFDKNLYIPYPHKNVKHDINYDAKLSICMHIFTKSVGYKERTRKEGVEKFQLETLTTHRTKQDRVLDKARYRNNINDNDNNDDDNFMSKLFNDEHG
jgi:hypothetical protein